MRTEYPPPDRASLAGSETVVLGLGRAGIGMATALLRIGARVTGYDVDPAAVESAAVVRLRARGLGVTYRPAARRYDWAVVSPGIPEGDAAIQGLRCRGVPVVDELDLAARLLGGTFVGVTGTNGKSTTTAMIGAILAAAGRRVFVGGNLAPGEPLSHALGRRRYDAHVVEVSSFQLERAVWFAPTVAVITNVTADHLNRHRSVVRYADCKFRILDRQGPSDLAVLNADDPVSRPARDRGVARRCYFSLRRRRGGAWLETGQLRYEGRRVIAAQRMGTVGRHNIANAAAATCAAAALGAGVPVIRRALAGFRGLPHRLEVVGRRRGITWVNNSMCTNPAAGISSLRAFGRRVVLITGGREKGLALADYVREIVRRARCALLIGESGGRLLRALVRAGFGRAELCGTLAVAIQRAAAVARTGDTVLFSPAFASFDQFRDFRDRGDAFRQEVAGLG